jgi:hypothetical protein
MKMKNFGLSTVSEFLADHIVYRNLEPADGSLPGLSQIGPKIGLSQSGAPRKTQPAYAQVVAFLLQEAQRQRGVKDNLRNLVLIGDTRMLDGTAFINLCQAGGWRGVAFIGSENKQPASVQVEELPGGEKIYQANRWAALADFVPFCLEQGISIDESTALVLDLDKTILGARGRNAHTIDQARVNAVQHTVADLLGKSFDLQLFRSAYDLFNQVEFHPFTADNQDYLAYICLIIGSGLEDAERLARQVREKKLHSFDDFIVQVDKSKNSLPENLAAIHSEIYRFVCSGDPTPFKAFRRNEYLLTIACMGFMPNSTPIDVLLDQEILITQEVRQIAISWKERGALLFGLSDKPDEATFPTAEQSARGYVPLHRTQTHVVGAE